MPPRRAAAPWSWLRPLLLLAGLLPLARLLWLGANDALTANPFEFVTRSTGTWALVFLCLTLTMTPLRRLTGQPGWAGLRRPLGLYCFFYATLHFALWFAVDHRFDAAAMWRDVLRRPFISAGFIAFVLLMPLAATSTHAMMRRLGANWRRLHRLVYPVAIVALLHYGWHKAGKNDFGTLRIYVALLAVLLGLRLYWAIGAWLARRREPPL